MTLQRAGQEGKRKVGTRFPLLYLCTASKVSTWRLIQCATFLGRVRSRDFILGTDVCHLRPLLRLPQECCRPRPVGRCQRFLQRRRRRRGLLRLRGDAGRLDEERRCRAGSYTRYGWVIMEDRHTFKVNHRIGKRKVMYHFIIGGQRVRK